MINRFLVFVFLFIFSNSGNSQLGLNDLIKSTQLDRDSYIEFLMSKNFKVIATPGYWLGAYGQFFDEVTLSSRKSEGSNDYIFVDLENSNKDKDGHVSLNNRKCEFEFNGSTCANFQKIHSEIKANYKKIDFFLDKNINSYVTQYKIGEFYVYVGNKNCWNKNGTPLDLGYIGFENYLSPWH